MKTQTGSGLSSGTWHWEKDVRCVCACRGGNEESCGFLCCPPTSKDTFLTKRLGSESLSQCVAQMGQVPGRLAASTAKTARSSHLQSSTRPFRCQLSGHKTQYLDSDRIDQVFLDWSLGRSSCPAPLSPGTKVDTEQAGVKQPRPRDAH